MRRLRWAGLTAFAWACMASLSGCAADAPAVAAQLQPERCEVTGSRIVSRRNCGGDTNVHSVTGEGVRTLMDRPVLSPAAPGGG